MACESFDPPTAPRSLGLSAFPVPIMDGGGLYGGGANAPPPSHLNAGLDAAAEIPASGAIVVSLGQSITKSAFEGWQAVAQTDAVMVNGACSGCTVDYWKRLGRKGWVNAFQQLSLAGLARADVDVVWMSVTKTQTTSATKAELDTVLMRIREAYPNARQVFVSNRTYGGYRESATSLSAEPGAWQDGVAVRAFVLAHLGETAPWVGWAGDLWANGDTPRSDGLRWLRSDFAKDGLHYSVAGTAKLGALVRDQFEASPFTDWYAP